MRTHLGIDIDALDLDKARFAIRETRARNRAFALAGDNSYFHIPIKGARFILVGGADLDTAFLGDHGCRHHVYVGVGAAHDAGHNGTVQRGQVHIGHNAIVENIDGFDRFVGHLADEAAQMAGQFHPRAHNLGFFGRHRGHVQRVFHCPIQQIVRHLFSHLQRHVFLRFGGGGAQMRGADHVWQVKQRVFDGRLDAEHIKGGAGHMARFQHICQRFLVHQPTAGTVDDAHAFLGFLQVLAA